MVTSGKVHHFEEEVEGILRWMQEVDVFLAAEDPAVGDRATLEAQLKESNALQDDIATLSPNLGKIDAAGQQLLSKCAPTENFREEELTRLRSVKSKLSLGRCGAT